MSKAKQAKDGRVPAEKLIIAESKRKRKLVEDPKENSPAKEAVPPTVETTSPASQHGAEDSGELELPEKIAKPKKVLNFRNHFPAGARSCRPLCNYSEDDDEDSIAIKDQEIELVMQKNEIYYEQRTGDEDNPGEDSPFWSNTPLPGLAERQLRKYLRRAEARKESRQLLFFFNSRECRKKEERQAECQLRKYLRRAEARKESRQLLLFF